MLLLYDIAGMYDDRHCCPIPVNRYVHLLGDAPEAVEQVGEKAAGLGRLVREGVSEPTAEAARAFLRSDGLARLPVDPLKGDGGAKGEETGVLTWLARSIPVCATTRP